MPNILHVGRSLGLGAAIALLGLGWSGDRAWASYNYRDCQQVREVRALARRSGLDGGNLAALEILYCRRSGGVRRPSQPDASDECQALTVMAQLARLEQGQTALARAVQGQQQVACNLAGRDRLDRRLTYPNGQATRFGSSWRYPNGQNARFGSSWYYPSGTQAKFSSSWNYPNGSRARFGSSWRYPNGTIASEQQLLSWACAVVPSSECNQRLQEIRSRSGDAREVAIVALAWRAYQIGGAPD